MSFGFDNTHIATMDNESYDFIFKIVLLGDSGVGKSCYYLEMAMNIYDFVQVVNLFFSNIV